jgi:hypothetical protein
MVDKVPATGKWWWVVLVMYATLCLAACSPAFSGRVGFTAPQGWIHSNDPTAGETWIDPDGSHQTIMAQTTNSPLPPHEPGWKDIKICGNHPAVLMFQKQESGDLWEAISTTYFGHRYMAVYTRPAGMPPDPRAEAALRTICLKSK